MAEDIYQLVLWLLIGPFITWGVFYAWLGFRSAAGNRDYTLRERGIARGASTFALVFAVLWIIIWVSAVFVNTVQLSIGDHTWLPIPFPSSFLTPPR